MPEHREKAKVAVSRYSLPCPNQPCRRMGPSLACPDVSDETPERDGDIGSILDSRCRQISRTWMLQQLLFSNEHQSWPALKLRRVFAQHFLSFGVFSWLVKRAHSCKHRVGWKWYLGKDGLLYQRSGNMSYLRCYVDVGDDHGESPLVLVVELMKVMMVMRVMRAVTLMRWSGKLEGWQPGRLLSPPRLHLRPATEIMMRSILGLTRVIILLFPLVVLKLSSCSSYSGSDYYT